MSARGWIWIFLGGLTIAVGAVLGLQRQRVQQLRGEIGLLQDDRRELVGVKAEHMRLTAAQPSAEEWAAWRANDAERIRREYECAELQSRLAGDAPAVAVEAESANDPIAASAWKNAGRASPEAVLETALWAAAGGEIETLAGTLLLEPATRTRAEALLANLPAALRGNYTTPERLVALLTAREVPLGTMRLIARMDRGPEDVLLRVQLQQTDGSAVMKSLAVRGQPGDWRLVVPENAMDRFETMLRGPIGPATP